SRQLVATARIRPPNARPSGGANRLLPAASAMQRPGPHPERPPKTTAPELANERARGGLAAFPRSPEGAAKRDRRGSRGAPVGSSVRQLRVQAERPTSPFDLTGRAISEIRVDGASLDSPQRGLRCLPCGIGIRAVDRAVDT